MMGGVARSGSILYLFQSTNSLTRSLLVTTNLLCTSSIRSIFRQNLESIAMSMQGKMLEIRARQEGQRHRAAAEGGN